MTTKRKRSRCNRLAADRGFMPMSIILHAQRLLPVYCLLYQFCPGYRRRGGPGDAVSRILHIGSVAEITIIVTAIFQVKRDGRCSGWDW